MPSLFLQSGQHLLDLVERSFDDHDIGPIAGETFAIGGLIQQQDVIEMSGLPILKDLPILGQFFRRTTKDKIKTELVIFVTAKVVGPGAHTNALPLSQDSDIMKRKTNLPGGRG